MARSDNREQGLQFAYLAGFTDMINIAVLSLQCAMIWLEELYEPMVMTHEIFELVMENMRKAPSVIFPHHKPDIDALTAKYEEGQTEGLLLMGQVIPHLFPVGERLESGFMNRLIRWVGMEPLDASEIAALDIGQPLYYVSGRGEERIEALARVCGKNSDGAINVKITKILYDGGAGGMSVGTIVERAGEGTLYMRAMRYPMLMPGPAIN